jgi:hypothetical protein
VTICQLVDELAAADVLEGEAHTSRDPGSDDWPRGFSRADREGGLLEHGAPPDRSRRDRRSRARVGRGLNALRKVALVGMPTSPPRPPSARAISVAEAGRRDPQCAELRPRLRDGRRRGGAAAVATGRREDVAPGVEADERHGVDDEHLRDDARRERASRAESDRRGESVSSPAANAAADPMPRAGRGAEGGQPLRADRDHRASADAGPQPGASSVRDSSAPQPAA